MAFIHGYIDRENGNLGYSGDLIVTEAVYEDHSREPVQVGSVVNLTYFRIGRHFFESLERRPANARWPALNEYPRFLSTTPTTKEN